MEEWIGGKGRRREGRGNCGQDVRYERRINKNKKKKRKEMLVESVTPLPSLCLTRVLKHKHNLPKYKSSSSYLSKLIESPPPPENPRVFVGLFVCLFESYDIYECSHVL